MTRQTPLPTHLVAAYDWTDAAGELNDLRTLTGDALDAYCAESAANCASESDGSVSADDLDQLHDWLVRDHETQEPTMTILRDLPTDDQIIVAHDHVTEWADCADCGVHLDPASDPLAPADWDGSCWRCGAPAERVGLRTERPPLRLTDDGQERLLAALRDVLTGATADALDTARARTAWFVEAEELATDARDMGESSFIEVREFDTASGLPEIIDLPREWFR